MKNYKENVSRLSQFGMGDSDPFFSDVNRVFSYIDKDRRYLHRRDLAFSGLLPSRLVHVSWFLSV